MMQKRLYLAALATLCAACSTPESIVAAAKSNAEVASRAAEVAISKGLVESPEQPVAGGVRDADDRAKAQTAPAVLRRASRPWIGATAVAFATNDKLPSVFTESVRLAFDDQATGGKVSLAKVADRVTKLTGVPVRVKSDVYRAETSPASAPAAAQPAGVPLPSLDGKTTATAQPAAPVSSAAPDTSLSALDMRWSGTLEQFLERVTDRLGLSWEYRDGVVVIERFRTESFEIAMLDSETSYSMGLSSSDQATTGTSSDTGSSAGLSANAQTDVKETGKQGVVAGVLKGINQIISKEPGSTALLAESSGRVLVTTTKDAMAKVRSFVREENGSMLRQAQIQFDIYSIKSSDSDEKGVDWSAVYKSLSGNYGISLASPASLTTDSAGGVTFNILSGGTAEVSKKFGDSSAMLKLLSSFGKTVEHKPISLLSLNRQWVRKASLSSRAYVSETTAASASLTGTSTPGLKTSSVTTGDRYIAMPQILDNNTILLKFGLGLSSLTSLEKFTSGSGDSQQSVQTPETANVIDQATVALRPGQVLAITGLSRITTADEKNTLTDGAPVIAGGSKKVSRVREDFIVFVRSTTL